MCVCLTPVAVAAPVYEARLEISFSLVSPFEALPTAAFYVSNIVIYAVLYRAHVSARGRSFLWTCFFFPFSFLSLLLFHSLHTHTHTNTHTHTHSLSLTTSSIASPFSSLLSFLSAPLSPPPLRLPFILFLCGLPHTCALFSSPLRCASSLRPRDRPRRRATLRKMRRPSAAPSRPTRCPAFRL